MTALNITQAERNGWQCRAVATLVRLLDEHRDLPVIAWTVGSAEPVIIGRIDGLQPSAVARAVFDAWAAALALDERWEPKHLALTYLNARVRRDTVTILLLADLILDEDGGQR